MIAEWNLARFAEALLMLLSDDDEGGFEEGIALAEESFSVFRRVYEAEWSAGMRAKLGLSGNVDVNVLTPLVDDLLELLKESRVDYTSFFHQLRQAAQTEPALEPLVAHAKLDEWVSRWRALRPDPELMDRTNPIYIPRNHLVEEALTAATAGDLDPVLQLLDAVTAPFDERPGLERYASPAPDDFGPYRTFCGT